jgi:hypothetical protein
MLLLIIDTLSSRNLNASALASLKDKLPIWKHNGADMNSGILFLLIIEILRNNKKVKSWLKWLMLTIPLVAGTIYTYWDMLVYAYDSYYGIVDEKLLKYEWYAAEQIIAHKIQVTSKGYKVGRKALASVLAPLIGTSSGQYYIMVGPRGCGKSTAIEQACEGMEGVARIRVDKANVNVFELVADAFGVNSSYYSFKKQDDLVKLFRHASAKKGGDWVPTIIAEIDRGAELGTVETVSKALKVSSRF